MIKVCTIIFYLFLPIVFAKNNDNGQNMSLTIYTDNYALIRDTRKFTLNIGLNDLIFDNIAKTIQNDSVVLYGENIKVLEQNYNYNLLNYYNLMENLVGQNVVTIRTHPQTGENIIEKAKLLSFSNGNPILQFSYGVEANFNGRIAFEKLPNDLRDKPLLSIKLDNRKNKEKELSLIYLASDISWKANYIANIISQNLLNLTSFVTINNSSGINYDNVKVQLISGKVNLVKQNYSSRNVLLSAKMSMDSLNENSLGNYTFQKEGVSNYELYSLSNNISIKDQQSKQIVLFKKDNVKFTKEFVLNSPLYFTPNGSRFEKLNPDIFIIINNNKDSNLGVSLPLGNILFYENDRNSNLQFVGSSYIDNISKNEILKLKIGQNFNVFINGFVSKIGEKEVDKQAISNNCFMVQNLITYEVNVNINNSEKDLIVLNFKQSLPDNCTIKKESIKSELEQVNIRNWKIKVPSEKMVTLKFIVEVLNKNKNCN